MSPGDPPWVVSVDHVWKRYCRTLRRSALYALADSARAFVGGGPPGPDLREDEFWSLQDVSFRVARGESLALVGRNGAGKTSLLKLLAGVHSPDRGELRTRGRLVSLMLVGAGFHPMLSGRENIYIYGSMLGMTKAQLDARLAAIIEFADIPGFLDSPVKFYSSGMYVRLAFSVAVHVDPGVFLIDEMLAVGDQPFREKCIARLLELKAGGCSMIIVSHSASHLRRLTDRALWLENGRIVAQGTTEEVLAGYAEAGPAPTAAPLVAPAPRSPSLPTAPHPLDGPLELRSTTLDGREVTAGLTLQAHAAHSLRVDLRALGPCGALRTVLELRREGGAAPLCALEHRLPQATYPLTAANTDLRLSWRLRASVAPGDHQLRLLVRSCDDAGAGRPLLDQLFACVVEGAAAPLAAELRVIEPASSRAPARPAVVEEGAAMAVDLRVERGASSGAPDALAWVVTNGAGDEVARAPVATDRAPPFDVVGGFRAHLPPGTYGELVELTWRDGSSERVSGPAFVVPARGFPLGFVDLEARARWDASARSPRAGTSGDGPALELGRLRLHADGSTLAPLVSPGGEARLDVDLTRVEESIGFFEPGERCRLTLRARAGVPLRAWALELWWTNRQGWRSAGAQFTDATHRAPGVELEVVVELALHLSPGEYSLGCAVSARTDDGAPVRVEVATAARCVLLGPGPGGVADGRVELLAARESAPTPIDPSEGPRGRGLTGRIVDLSLTPLDGDAVEPLVAPAAIRTRARVAFEFSGPVRRPTFKFAWLAPEQDRIVARVMEPDHLARFAPVEAPQRRDLEVELVHHLAGGVYWLQASVHDRDDAHRTLDARWRLTRCFVPASGVSSGRALLAGDLVVVPHPGDEVLNESVETLGLGEGGTSALKAARIETLGALCALEWSDVRALPGLGDPAVAKELERALARRGLCTAPSGQAGASVQPR